jgi:hypothetical protein
MPKMVSEGRGEVPEGAHQEALRVTRALAGLIEDSGRSIREVEAAIGWTQGVLNGILDYRTPLTFSRIVAVLSELGVSPARFFGGLYEPEKPVRRGDPTRGGSGAVRQETMDEFLDGLTGPGKRALQKMMDQRIEETLIAPLEEIVRRWRGEA